MAAETGWYYADWLWKLRGAIDRVMGGVGMRRGRLAPDSLSVGDKVDFWRVEAFEPNRRLRLAAEMKLPGRVWLEFEVSGDPGGARFIRLPASTHSGSWEEPIGIPCIPCTKIVFEGMLRRIAEAPLRPRRRQKQ